MANIREEKSLIERMVNREFGDVPCVIMHKNTVYKGLLFDNVLKARNYLKMCNTKRRFKEPTTNTFICTQHGTRFEVLILKDYE